jgi:hypothetical protein
MRAWLINLFSIKTARTGSILLYVMVFGSISFSVIVMTLATYAISENRASVSKSNGEEAFQIAEAGIAYYRWHLAHNPLDFTDGTNGAPGPYVHDYKDKNGSTVGKFSLDITPPSDTSTIVYVKSTGWVTSQPNTKRIIKVKLGLPSLTDFAFITNANVWIGSTEQTHGKFHANGGIRYDGLGDAPITSAVATYVCQPIFGNGCANTVKPGIWGDGGPQNFWQFPVPAQDFTAITADLAQIKQEADDNGLYLSASGENGWALTFSSSSQIFARKVMTVNCYSGQDIGESRYTPKCIDAGTYGPTTTYPMPANGRVFVEDTVWVDGTIKGHVVVANADGKSIIINGNIIYTAKDGRDTLGLMAQKDILVPYNSPDNLEIDAALLAQTGAAKRYNYQAGSKDRRNSIIIYGAVVTYGIWTWSWVNNGGQVVSGYVNTNSTYDANLTYSPPPGFPLGSEYNLITWELLN